MDEPPEGWGYLAKAMLGAWGTEDTPERMAADQASDRLLNSTFDMKLIPDSVRVLHQRGQDWDEDVEQAKKEHIQGFRKVMALPPDEYDIFRTQRDLWDRWFGPGEKDYRREMLRDAQRQSDAELLDEWSVSKEARSHRKEKIRRKIDRLESIDPARQRELEEELKQIKDDGHKEKRSLIEGLIRKQVDTDAHWSTRPRGQRKAEAMARASRLRIDERRDPASRKRHWADYKETERRLRHADIERKFDEWREYEKNRFKRIRKIDENAFRA
jgi:hypothetical protein